MDPNAKRPNTSNPAPAGAPSGIEPVRTYDLDRRAYRPARLVDRILTVKQVALLLGYDYKYTLSLFHKGVIPGRQRAKGCKITVRRSTIDRLFPEQVIQNHCADEHR